jgi:enoyl-CoA hydratase
MVRIEKSGPVTTVILSRKAARNAIDRQTAALLCEAFDAFDKDDAASVAVLHGEGGHFCAGADLKAIAAGEPNELSSAGNGPLGPTRWLLSKPVIAAVSGYAVAGGLELALWCDLRVAEKSAIFGVFCRRFGVPLIDGGTVRLPRLVGMGRAMDMILSGRPVPADEALQIGLCNRVVADGEARAEAERWAHELSALPQICMRSDRMSAYAQWGRPQGEALRDEFRRGLRVIESGEMLAGAAQFKEGKGRHGER